MVRDPVDYPYSSYRGNALGDDAPLTTPHVTFIQLAGSRTGRCAAYRRLFEDVLDRQVIDRIRSPTNALQILGNDQFIDQIEEMLGRCVRAKKCGRPKKLL